MEPRPSMRRNCCSSLSSLTESAVGLTDEGCCAGAGGASATSPANASAAKTSRRRATSVMPLPPFSFTSPRKRGEGEDTPCLHRDLFAVRRLPAPRAGTVAALQHPFLVDLRDDLAVAGEQRFGRAHLRAQRQLAFGEAVGAVFLVFGHAAVGLRAAGAERAGVEAIAAADADVLRMQNDTVGGGVERIDRTHRLARRVGAMHAGHRDRALAGLAVIDRHDAAAV